MTFMPAENVQYVPTFLLLIGKTLVTDMEEKIEYILKIIQKDGDTFRQRAEMYYKKWPELVNFVEDSF